MPSFTGTLFGWSIVVVIVVLLILVILDFVVQRSKPAWTWFTAFALGVPILAVVVGAVAGFAERSVFAAVAATLLLGGTFALLLGTVSKKDGSSLLEHDTRDAVDSAGWALMINSAVFALLAVFWP